MVFNGSVADTIIEVLAVESLIIVSDAAVDLNSIDALLDIILGVLADVDVSLLMDVKINMFAGAMTISESGMQGPLEFRS